MPPDFAKFFEQALPKDGGRHILALGEWHRDVAQLKFLKKYLPELKEKYGVNGIGLERDAFFNVFLWAYADGTLEQQLGSQKNVHAYLRAVFAAFLERKYKDNAIATADITIAAMDAGMEVIAFDSRETLAATKQRWTGQIDELNDYVASRAKDRSAEAVLMDIRKHSKSFSAKHADKEHVWMLGEVDWLLGLKQEYQTKLNAMEQLIKIGHKEIRAGRLTSDGLSAALGLAQMPDVGNCVTISGSKHINGIGVHDQDFLPQHPEQVHGTFGHHLFAMRRAEGSRADTVTAAMIATVAVAGTANEYSMGDFEDHHARAITGHTVAHWKLNNGTFRCLWPSSQKVEKLWQPPQDHPRVVPLEEKFPVPRRTTAEERPAIHAAHLDPLKTPAIKQAFDELRALMHPPSKVYVGRLGNSPEMGISPVN